MLLNTLLNLGKFLALVVTDQNFQLTFIRYMKPTFWNNWGPQALFKRIIGKPIPGDAFLPKGYLISEVGPKIAQKRNKSEHDVAVAGLMSKGRGGCPFAFS